jgi:hypothetical protein
LLGLKLKGRVPFMAGELFAWGAVLSSGECPLTSEAVPANLSRISDRGMNSANFSRRVILHRDLHCRRVLVVSGISLDDKSENSDSA